MSSRFGEQVCLEDAEPISHTLEEGLLFAGFPESTSTIPRERETAAMLNATHSTIEALRKARATPIDFILTIISDDNDDFKTFRTAFYSVTNKKKVEKLLTAIWNNAKGNETFKDWMQPHALDLVCDDIHKEMEVVKPSLFMNVEDVTPNFISTWDIHAIMGPVSKHTPSWTAVLKAATEKKNEKSQQSRNRTTTRELINAQVHFLSSYRSCKVQLGLGLMAWSTGASRQLLNVLYQAGLCSSFTAINHIIESLANHSMNQAKLVSSGPHVLAYDNINLSSSIFVEQTPSSMSKVQSGTFAVIYDLPNVQTDDMRIAPMIERLKHSSPLCMSDLRLSKESSKSYFSQTSVNVCRILFKYVKGFEGIEGVPILQHVACRKLPDGHKTRFYPTCASVIEEASVHGNLLLQDDIYTIQLEKKPEDLSEYAIPSINDQLTNARIRGAQALRAKDVSAWERREIFQLAFGIFHLVMNLIWALLQTH